MTEAGALGNDDGVLQRSIGYLWSQVESHPEASYSFKASYLEIYNEQVSGMASTTSENHPSDPVPSIGC